MLPSPPSLAIETSLACQHVERVTHALKSNSGGGWAGHAQLVIYWLVDTTDALHLRKAAEAYAQVSINIIGPELLLDHRAGLRCADIVCRCAVFTQGCLGRKAGIVAHWTMLDCR